MTRFHDYDNLFAEHGDLDIPENFTVGVAIKPCDNVTLALDIQRILYSEVAAIGNPANECSFKAGMGSDQGPGFGWDDMTVFKLGVSWDVSSKLTLRAGYNYSMQPIPDDQTCFNILAPGVVEHHLTAGFTYRLTRRCDLSFFYVHAFENTVHGDQSANGLADLSMSQDAFGISIGWSL
jgi:long-chain fatty acid transport protein